MDLNLYCSIPEFGGDAVTLNGWRRANLRLFDPEFGGGSVTERVCGRKIGGRLIFNLVVTL